jgi:hypothetical protein
MDGEPEGCRARRAAIGAKAWAGFRDPVAGCVVFGRGAGRIF